MHTHLASAVFDTRAEAARAVEDLRAAGVPDGALSVIGRDHDAAAAAAAPGPGDAADDGGGPMLRGILGGGAIGAAAGAAAGTLNEALATHGVGREDADYYGDALSRGGVFVSVDARSGDVSSEAASDILYRNGGHSTKRSRLSSRRPARPAATNAARNRNDVPLS